MQRVGEFRLFPAVCSSCGTTEGGGIDLAREIDTGLEKLHRIYLCDTCVLEITTLYEMISPEEANRLVEARRVALAEMFTHRNREEALQKIVRDLGTSGLKQYCKTCDWTGSSVKQHARSCKVDNCPHAKPETPVEVLT